MLDCSKRIAPNHTCRPSTLAIVIGAVALSLCQSAAPVVAWQPNSKSVAAGEKHLDLESSRLTESSGLAFSGVDQDYLWTHNDSGGKPRLYAFDEKGQPGGHVTLDGINANDWEDMASFTDGVPRLLVADVGDNQRSRRSVSIYLFDEPSPKKKLDLKSFQQLVVRYTSGPRDCESVAVDLVGRRILLLSKSIVLATIHEIPLPARTVISANDGAGAGITRMDVTARQVARLALPMATGMDVCPVTGDIWITSYLHAFRFPVSKDSRKPMNLQQVFSQIPQRIDLPKLRQVEAIAVDDQARVWVTSEGRPTKLQRVVR